MNNIFESVNNLLNQKLLKRLNEKLNKSTCIEIYTDIFYTLSSLIEESKVPLSNEGVNLLSQIYYDSIKINNSEELDPNIFSKRASFDEISTKELSLLTSLFNGTEFGSIFHHHLKKRI